jgi:hexosaminidase
VFDILDEVLEVFKPNYVNIGHDECYSLARCPKCIGKNPTELYVGDIVKINNYLKEKNIKSIMWADKFFGNVFLMDEDGTVHGFGGAEDERWDVPYLADCVGKIPKDIMLFHWYWPYSTAQEERDLLDMGYSMIYGNFQPLKLKEYRKRIAGVEGALVSNWGSYAEEYMQRNGQNFNLTALAWTLWNDRYDTNMGDEITEKVMNVLYDSYKQTLGDDIIELVHTTDYDRPYKAFYDGVYIIPEEWAIGEYEVTYTDGTKVTLPITFGYNIRSCTEELDVNGGYETAEGSTSGIVEVAGASLPIKIGDKTFYKTAYKNPYPDKKIEKIGCIAFKDVKIETIYEGGE